MSIKRKDKIEAHFEGGVYVLPGARKVIPVASAQAVASGPVQLAVGFDDGKEQIFKVVLP